MIIICSLFFRTIFDNHYSLSYYSFFRFLIGYMLSIFHLIQFFAKYSLFCNQNLDILVLRHERGSHFLFLQSLQKGKGLVMSVYCNCLCQMFSIHYFYFIQNLFQQSEIRYYLLCLVFIFSIFYILVYSTLFYKSHTPSYVVPRC